MVVCAQECFGRPPLSDTPGRRAVTRVLRRLLLLAWLLATVTAGRPAWAADAPPLVFGVFPYVTAKQTIEIYRPLADDLEKHLHRRVELYTARDFRTFVDRTRQGRYDIVLTAPHLALLARQDAGYLPLLKYLMPVKGLLVVRADSPFHTPEAIRGRTLTTADPMAVAILATQAHLTALGLRLDIDYQTRDAVTHSNAAMQVIQGSADGALLALQPYKMMPPELRRQLRVLAETPPLPGLMYLAHPRLRDEEAMAVQKALLQFAASSGEPARAHRDSHGGLAPVDGSEMRAIRPYARQIQELLLNTP